MTPDAPPFQTAAVARAFAAMPDAPRARLLEVRGMVFAIAAATEGAGPLQETLKWGQPSYLTPHTRAGTTLRLAPARTGEAGVFVHSQTSVIAEMRQVAGPDVLFDGNRGLLMDPASPIPRDLLALLIGRALTYHTGSREGSSGTRPASVSRKQAPSSNTAGISGRP